MQELTIQEIVHLWSVKYKYDHILHGFKFEDKQITADEAHAKLAHLKAVYGDII